MSHGIETRLTSLGESEIARYPLEITTVFRLWLFFLYLSLSLFFLLQAPLRLTVIVSPRIAACIRVLPRILFTSRIVFLRFSRCVPARVIFSSPRYHLRGIKAAVNDAPVRVRTVRTLRKRGNLPARALPRITPRVLEAIDGDFNNRLHYVQFRFTVLRARESATATSLPRRSSRRNSYATETRSRRRRAGH